MAQNTHITVEKLHQLLVCEANGYRQLVALAQRERAALRAENLAELAAAVQHKESLLPQLKQWETAREQLVARLRQDLQLAATATLGDLLERLDGAIAQKLTVLRTEFVSLVEQLVQLNHGNQLMLHSGLARVDATFGYLASLAAPPDGHYTPRGGGPVQTPTGNVLNWEV